MRSSCYPALYILPSHFLTQEVELTAGCWKQERPELTSKGFAVTRVDYSRPASLHVALVGVDTVISTISSDPQLALIDSCLTAKVRRFAPAEFEGVPWKRPMIEQGREKISTLNRLREVRDRLQSAVFCCGLFYEWLSPGGLLKSGVSIGSVTQSPGFGEEGSFLVDMGKRKARIPAKNVGGGDVYACFTAAEDVGKFVARCLEVENWPEQFRMHGERLKLVDLVGIVEGVLGPHISTIFPARKVPDVLTSTIGHKFDVKILSSEDLDDQLLDAEDAHEEADLEALIAIQRGEFDFKDPNVNQMFPNLEPTPLRKWLQNVWG